MSVNFRGQFLISMPHIDDEVFHRSVIFVLEHTDQFVLGVIINQQNLLSKDEISAQYDLAIDPKDIDKLNFISGGPVRLKELFVLHEHIQKWHKAVEIAPGVDITTSADVLATIIESYPEISHSIIDSYSVWSTEQFNEELKRNVWMPLPFDKQFLFSRDERELLWNDLFESSGVKIQSLSQEIGTA
ncbi:YqgE/AlgH family protein [Wohlfahrtiimonas sp. G9077]|uniref:YqgE/AlgH family protein n=1 Tax=Wohlfahrtiimonas sp. G9077 TaxID=1980118 RepID=UPI000B98D1A8|nr:YqgE/AlgH family protein [Wohlfahrtiimonas sp. G9077]OYQ73478.1 hypothetical protein B9T20_07090 [Wohlfahrtiimonas sp. G9077]